MKAFSFFFWALLGLELLVISGSGICFAQNQVTVTAEVLESITYLNDDGMVDAVTNLNIGYWIITGQNKRYIVAKF